MLSEFKLTDFGVSKRISENSEFTGVKGTLHY